MSFIKKYAWYGSAVVASALLAVALLLAGPADSANAAVFTAPTVNLTPAQNSGTGSGKFTAATLSITESAVADWALGEDQTITLPAGYEFNTAVTPTVSGTNGFAAGCTPPVALAVTCTATASSVGSPSVITITGIQVTPTAPGTADSTAAWSGTGPLSGTALILDMASGNSVSVTVSPTSIAANGSQAATITALVFEGLTAVTTSTAVNFTVSIGAFTSNATTATSFTTGGVATVAYKGTGTAGTDTIVASVPSLSAVDTTTVALTTATGTTPTTLAMVSVSKSNVAASTTTYASPTTSSNVTFKVTDASGAGVNNQLLQINTDIGAIAVGASESCTGVSSKTITDTSKTISGVAGRSVITYCPSSTALGTATITVTDITVATIPAATATLTVAGVPTSLTSAVVNNAVTATVADAAGNAAANGTVVRFTIPSTQGVVSVTCTVTTGGTAGTTAALVGTSGNVLISTEADAGTAPTCPAPGTAVASAVATVGVPGTTPPPTTGEGTFDREVPNVGVNTAVFNGGTVAQLSAATAAAGGISVTVFVNGQATVLIPGAPAFVNAAFNAAFPTGSVPAGTIVLVVK